MACYLSRRSVRARPRWGVGKIATPSITNLRSSIVSGFVAHGTGTSPEGNTVYAASPELSDWEAAIAAANPEDRVVIPPGTADWTGRLEITKPVIITAAGIGQTIINSYYMPPDINNYNKLNRLNYLISYYPSNPSTTKDLSFRLSGFTVNCQTNSFGLILYNPTYQEQRRIRADHLRIYNTRGKSASTWHGGKTFFNYGPNFGIVDNCVIGELTGTYVGIDAIDMIWAHADGWYDFGSQRALYLEDNLFYGFGLDSMLVASEKSARYCIRHNYFDGTSLTGGVYTLFDMHGNQSNAISATIAAEVYENDIYVPFSSKLVDQRGGKVLMFNNRITTGGASLAANVREEQNDSRGVGPANGPTGQSQHVSDSYYWNNTKNGVPLTGPTISQTVNYADPLATGYDPATAWKGVVPRNKRDYWVEGDGGVVVGLLGNRPSAGLVVGQGYWATDTQILYRATGATTWEEFYQPLTYPHPFRWDSILGD